MTDPMHEKHETAGADIELQVREVMGTPLLDIYVNDWLDEPQRLVLTKDEGIVLLEWLSRATA